MRPLLLFLSLLLFSPVPAVAGPLHEAAKAGDVDAIRAELDAGAKVDEPDKGGTALFYAVQRGHPDAAKLLIERGADISIAGSMGLPIVVAAL